MKKGTRNPCLMPFQCLFVQMLIFLILSGCGQQSETGFRISSNHQEAASSIQPGRHSLGLGGYKIVNGLPTWRDGILYVPSALNSGKPLPLLIWLHGGAGRAETFDYMFPPAEEAGVVILALDARHNTWDAIDGPFGTDVAFIDRSLKHVFEQVSIDPSKIALGGLSDGASYALALGRSNGDKFTHLVAVAPGFLEPPGPSIGKPKIFVAHGLRDTVYRAVTTRIYIVPQLKKAGYDTTYLEFEGPHWMTKEVGVQMLDWLKE